MSIHRDANSSYSNTTNSKFRSNPDLFFQYHAARAERMKEWPHIPYQHIAERIKNKSHKVVDFGCGENKMKKLIPNNEVISFDHVAFDDSVIACDMSDVSQYVKNEEVDVCVFCLSLWGRNKIDYLKEAHRVLQYDGIIWICEPNKSYDDEKISELIKQLKEIGFELIGPVEKKDKFFYIKASKY